MILIGQFLLLSIILFFVSFYLSKYADIFADIKQIDKSIIGLFLLAIITSMPELITTINSALVFDSPDMAVGNVLGSNLFNMLIPGLLGFVTVLWSINKLNVYMGFVSVILSLIILAALTNNYDIALFNFNSINFIVFFIYFLSLFFLKFRDSSTKEQNNEPISKKSTDITLKKVYVYLFLLGLTVVIAGTFFAYVCDRISKEFGLESSFVGLFFMAFATSLPELVVTFSSIKLGSYSMALGNVLGSNSFNLIIIAIADFITPKPLKYTLLNTKSFIITIIIMILFLSLSFNAAIIQEGKRKRNIGLAIFMLTAYIIYLYIIPK